MPRSRRGRGRRQSELEQQKLFEPSKPPLAPTRYDPYPNYGVSWKPNTWGGSRGLAPTYGSPSPVPPKRLWTKKGESKEKMTDEILALRREVTRLKDAQRDQEQMDDEVWIQDGRIWFQHRCNGALLEQEISHGWKITSSGDIRPSFSCHACNAHFNATVIVQLRRAGWAKPADWAPRYQPYKDWQAIPVSDKPTNAWKGVGL